MDGISNRNRIAGPQGMGRISAAKTTNAALVNEIATGFTRMFLGKQLVEVNAMGAPGVR